MNPSGFGIFSSKVGMENSGGRKVAGSSPVAPTGLFSNSASDSRSSTARAMSL